MDKCKLPTRQYKNRRPYTLTGSLAINWVAAKHGVSRRYVQLAIINQRTSPLAAQMQADFANKEKELQQVIADSLAKA
ncbi:MAG: hypothetical protein EAY75_15725 [Bacteroidetes bacterium]|nr:MAG: hypothetical protein EAY75_15725 [Bacteroidota bacterium]